MKKFFTILCFAFIIVGNNLNSQNLDQYLTHWWPFDNNFTDFVGNTVLSTTYLNNSYSFTQDRFGNANSAILFKGSGVLFNSTFSLANPSTISFWINPSVLSGCILATCWNEYYYNPGICLNGGGITLNTPYGGTNSSTACVNEINKWYHIVVTSQSANWNVYCNNLNVISVNDPSLVDNISLYIGGGPSNYFNGAIDDVKIYNIAMTEAQVKSLEYDAGSYVSNGNCITIQPDTTNAASYQWSTGANTASVMACNSNDYQVTVTDKSSNNSTYSFNTFISNLNDSIWTPDAPVHSIYRYNNTVYLGGEFDYL
jgi:hypothetical protein